MRARSRAALERRLKAFLTAEDYAKVQRIAVAGLKRPWSAEPRAFFYARGLRTAGEPAAALVMLKDVSAHPKHATPPDPISPGPCGALDAGNKRMPRLQSGTEEHTPSGTSVIIDTDISPDPPSWARHPGRTRPRP